MNRQLSKFQKVKGKRHFLIVTGTAKIPVPPKGAMEFSYVTRPELLRNKYTAYWRPLWQLEAAWLSQNASKYTEIVAIEWR